MAKDEAQTEGQKVSNKVKIRVLATQEDNSDVFLGLNGKTMQIKRGEKVEIDRDFVELLRNSKIDTVVHDFDAAGNKVARRLEMQRYPFEVIV